MKKDILFVIFLYLFTPNCLARDTLLSHRDILRQCDEARGNLSGVTWVVDILAVQDGTTESRRLSVKARGFDVLAETESPPRRRGDTLIMIDGNMWFYKPDLSKPTPISRRQKLIGKAANGDIAATNYADDYDILSLSDSIHDNEDCYLFELKANSASATYSRVRYWVSKKRLVGVKAEYYNTTGDKLLKSATMSFTNTVTTDNGQQPFISQMTITDELSSKDSTVLSFSAPRFTAISDDTFNLNLLRH